jgi:hypothetical protein
MALQLPAPAAKAVQVGAEAGATVPRAAPHLVEVVVPLLGLSELFVRVKCVELRCKTSLKVDRGDRKVSLCSPPDARPRSSPIYLSAALCVAHGEAPSPPSYLSVVSAARRLNISGGEVCFRQEHMLTMRNFERLGIAARM